jgi:hypothetical protein
MKFFKKIIALILVLTFSASVFGFYASADVLGGMLLNADDEAITDAVMQADGDIFTAVPQSPLQSFFTNIWNVMSENTQEVITKLAASLGIAVVGAGAAGGIINTCITANDWNAINNDPAVSNAVKQSTVSYNTGTTYVAGNISAMPAVPANLIKYSWFMGIDNNNNVYFLTATTTNNPIQSYGNGVYIYSSGGNWYDYRYNSSSQTWTLHSSLSDGYTNTNMFVGFETSVNNLALDMYPSGTRDYSSNTSSYPVTVSYNNVLESPTGVPVDIPQTNDVSIPIPSTLPANLSQSVAVPTSLVDTTTQPTDYSNATEHIDFTPLMNINFFNKFPFCLPTDFYNAVVDFIAPPAAPVFTIDLSHAFTGGCVLTLDMSQFNVLATIARWFEYIIFLVGLIKLTPKLIIM